MRYTIDTEFDGHRGPLISLALVPEKGPAYYVYTQHKPKDPWVVENVMPYVDAIHVPAGVRFDIDDENWLGLYINDYIRAVMQDNSPIIIADSPVDIARFCDLISTDSNGNWRSSSYSQMSFLVFNVDCWPCPQLEGTGAIQHNAYWDAVALWHKLRVN